MIVWEKVKHYVTIGAVTVFFGALAFICLLLEQVRKLRGKVRVGEVRNEIAKKNDEIGSMSLNELLDRRKQRDGGGDKAK
jgi:hypothetical protein